MKLGHIERLHCWRAPDDRREPTSREMVRLLRLSIEQAKRRGGLSRRGGGAVAKHGAVLEDKQ